MTIKQSAKKFWFFLQEDTWQSWIVSMLLIVILIKFILFPGLSLITGSQLPLVVVESCSMYHESSFQGWWDKNAGWYEQKNISQTDFESYRLNNGLNKGDIVVVWNNGVFNKGDIIIFVANTAHPIIHRIVSTDPLGTKGDHNIDQLSVEKNIPQEAIIGKAIARIPYVGWIKLIFFDIFNPPNQRGLCV